MNILDEIKEVKELADELDIPQYYAGLDDKEIIIMALQTLKTHLKENRDGIYGDIHEDDEWMTDSVLGE